MNLMTLARSPKENLLNNKAQRKSLLLNQSKSKSRMKNLYPSKRKTNPRNQVNQINPKNNHQNQLYPSQRKSNFLKKMLTKKPKRKGIKNLNQKNIKFNRKLIKLLKMFKKLLNKQRKLLNKHSELPNKSRKQPKVYRKNFHQRKQKRIKRKLKKLMNKNHLFRKLLLKLIWSKLPKPKLLLKNLNQLKPPIKNPILKMLFSLKLLKTLYLNQKQQKQKMFKMMNPQMKTPSLNRLKKIFKQIPNKQQMIRMNKKLNKFNKQLRQ